MPPEQNKPFVGDENAVEALLSGKNKKEYKEVLVKGVAGVSAPSAEAILLLSESVDPSAKGVAHLAAAFSNIRKTPYYAPSLKSEEPMDFEYKEDDRNDKRRSHN